MKRHVVQCLTPFPSKLQYQKCRDTFKKSCFYEYKKVPQQHNIEICNDNLRRDCGKKDGQEICTTEYVTGKSTFPSQGHLPITIQ